MNATRIENVAIPSPEEFGVVWETFYLVTAAIATYRANKNGPRRFGELAVHASSLLSGAAFSNDMATQVSDMAKNEHEKIALGILYEEMQFVSWKYRSAFEYIDKEMPACINAMGEKFQDEDGDPGHSSAIGDIENVVGSVNTLLDKLPNWMRKIMDVILEALRFTRGDVD